MGAAKRGLTLRDTAGLIAVDVGSIMWIGGVVARQPLIEDIGGISLLGGAISVAISIAEANIAAVGRR